MKDDGSGGAVGLSKLTPSEQTKLPHCYSHLVSHPGRTTLDSSECWVRTGSIIGYITHQKSHVTKTGVLDRVIHMSSPTLGSRVRLYHSCQGTPSGHAPAVLVIADHKLWFKDEGVQAGCQESNPVTFLIPLMMERPATTIALGSQDPLGRRICPGILEHAIATR